MMNVSFRIDKLGLVVRNLKKKWNFGLAANFNKNSDVVTVDGLSGVDYLQFMRPIKVIKSMLDSTYHVSTKIIYSLWEQRSLFVQ